MQWLAFQEKNLELRELESCKLGSMLILCSGGKYYLKMVCYTNLLEKTIQGKGQTCPCSQDRQKCEKYMENYL